MCEGNKWKGSIGTCKDGKCGNDRGGNAFSVYICSTQFICFKLAFSSDLPVIDDSFLSCAENIKFHP